MAGNIERTFFDLKTGKTSKVVVSKKDSDKQIKALLKKDKEFLEIMAKI